MLFVDGFSCGSAAGTAASLCGVGRLGGSVGFTASMLCENGAYVSGHT